MKGTSSTFEANGVVFTGRSIVTLRDGAGLNPVLNVVRADSELSIQHAQDDPNTDAIVLPELDVAIVGVEDPEKASVAVAEAGILVEPEVLHFPVQHGSYLEGFADGVREASRIIKAGSRRDPAPTFDATGQPERDLTWGLEAIGASSQIAFGAGVRVAVLDTGIDLDHPDLRGRVVTHASFVDGEHVQDGHGHGTHCCGTVAGPLRPGSVPRYGVAPEAELLVGKVLSNAGVGSTGGILNGISWAIRNEAGVISMSLGSRLQRVSPAYERAGQKALETGALIIAAAGNDSMRDFGAIAPCGSPANVPSIMSVAALRHDLGVAAFSNGAANHPGGEIDIAGPGVAVLSAWPLPRTYHRIDGTSMATPHVSGVAALGYEQGLRGRDLWGWLQRNARRLSQPSSDVGAGLVQVH